MSPASPRRDPHHQRAGYVKRGTAGTWKFGTQNIDGKRRFFSPRGQLAWTTNQAVQNKRGKEKKRSPWLLAWGGLRHGAPRCTALHPVWGPAGADLGAHPDTELLRSAPAQGDSAAFPKIIIIPQRQPHHLPVKTGAIRARSSSLVKSHLNEGSALLGGREGGEPRSAAARGIIVGQDYRAITTLYAAAIQLLKYKCLSRAPNRNPPVLPAKPGDRRGSKANWNYQFAGKAGRADAAAGWGG